jgi:hypothetical protein
MRPLISCRIQHSYAQDSYEVDMHIQLSRRLYGGNAQLDKSAVQTMEKGACGLKQDLLAQKQNAINAEQTLADVQRMWKWVQRSTGQQNWEEASQPTIAKRLLNGLNPCKGKNPLRACHDLGENFFDRPQKLPSAQMRIALSVLLERYQALGKVDRNGFAIVDKKVIPTLPATDAQIEPDVRRAILQCLLDRRYALQEGTTLNEENEKAAVFWVLRNMLRCVTNKGLRQQFMEQVARLFEKNNGPFTRDVLQQWKADILRSTCHLPGGPAAYHWDEFNRVTERKISPTFLNTMSLLHKHPALQDLTGLMTDLVKNSASGTGRSIGHLREVYVSTLPLFYKATEVTSNGIRRVGLNMGITRGRDATVSLFNTGSELQLLIHTGATTQAVAGVKGCASLNFGGPVAYGGITVGSDMAYTYGRGTHAGTLFRLPAADGASIAKQDKDRFVQLIKALMTPPDLALTSDDNGRAALARLAQIQSDFREIKIDMVDKVSSDHHFSIGGNFWEGIDLLFNKGIAPGVGFDMSAAIHFQKSTSVEKRQSSGMNTTTVSKGSRVSAEVGIGVAGGNLSGATTPHIRLLAGAGTNCHSTTWDMTKSPTEVLTCTESEGRLTSIVRTRKFHSKSGFLGALEKLLAANPSANPGDSDKGPARVRLEEIRHQVMLLRQDHADGGKLAFEIVQQLRPDSLQKINQLREATFHAARAESRKMATTWKKDADNLLGTDSAYHVLPANIILKNAQVSQRNVGFILPIGSHSRTAGTVEHRIAQIPLWKDTGSKGHIQDGDTSPVQEKLKKPKREPIKQVDRHQISRAWIVPRLIAALPNADAHQTPIPIKAPHRMADLNHAATRLRNRQQLSVDRLSS